MEYSPKQDFGNLGNLIVFLNGKKSISERLEIGKKIFYISLNVPPQHKEEVVVVWLMDILSTNKVLTFSDEEVFLIWRTLKEFFSSKRLKGLYSNHWICPITPPFVQTLLRASYGKAPRNIQHETLSICESLLNMSSFSPQVMVLTKQSFRLLSGVLKLTLEAHSFESFQSFIVLLLQKVTFVISNEMTKKENVMSLVFENQALNLLEILFELKKNNFDCDSELIKEIETYLNLVLFTEESMIGYSRIFNLTIFNIHDNSSHQRIGESFYSFISSLLTRNDKEKASYILKEFYLCFFHAFKKSEEFIFYAIIISMHLLGISYESRLKDGREKFASPSLVPVKLKKIHKHMFSACILEALLLAEVNVDFTSPEISFKDFLSTLFMEFISLKDPDEFTIQSLIFIIRMEPDLTSEHLDLLGNLLLLNREDTSLNENVDEIFCIILSINLKRRTVHEFLKKFSQVLLSLHENQLPLTLLHNDLQTAYLRKNSFLPCKFLKSLLAAIKELGTMGSLNVWISLQRILSATCSQLQAISSLKHLSKIAYVIWLSSCCLNATSVIDISTSNLISKVISVFNLFATDCIEPLMSDMSLITIGEKLPLMQALLNLILVWSEIHGNLCLSCDKYSKETKFPLRASLEENFKDVKSLIPFIDPTSSDSFSSFSDEEEDTSRYFMIQLLVQKLSLSRLQESETRVRETIAKSSTVIKVVDFILDVRDPSFFPMSSDILALHLPSFMPFLKKKNFINLARHFNYGIEENKESWIKFGKSEIFQESEMLQMQIFSLLCANLLPLLSGKKRKLDEDVSEEYSKTQSLNDLLIKRLILFQEKDISQSKFVANSTLLLTDLEELLKFHGVNCLKSRNEKKILTILQTLEMFPLSFLQPRFLMSVLTLTVIIAHSVGNIGSQKKMGPIVLNIINRIALSPNILFIFKLSKNKPHFLLSWFVNECCELVNNSHIGDNHLNAILLMKETLDVPKDTLHGFMNIICLFTSAFIQWNESGLQTKAYALDIINLSKKSGENQAFYLATSILICSIEKKFDGKVPHSWLDLVTHLCSWTLESANKMTLSQITKVPFVWVLLTFCQAMRIQMKLLSKNSGKQIKRSSTGTPRNGNLNECATSACNLALNWNSLIKTGLNFATLAVESEDKNLRKLALKFYLNTCSIARSVDNVDVWDLSQRIWQIMFTYEDHNIQEEKFFKILSPKQSLSVFKILVEEVHSDDADLPKLLRWSSAFITSNQELQNDPHFKSSSLFKELVIALCVKFSEENSSPSKSPPYVQLFKMLSCLFQTNFPISNNVKYLVLGLVSNCTFKNISSYELLESLQVLAKLLNLFLFKEHSLMNKKPSSFMSALTNIISILLNKSFEDGEEGCNEHNLKARFLNISEVEKCCMEIEKVTKNLKQFSRDIFKIAAFSLSSILEDMQKNKILPVVKLSMERIIYNLIDLSDPHTLDHLLVTLSPSAVTLLQHFYKSYNQSFRFDPRKT